MKNVFCAVALVMLMHTNFYAQITKADIEKMFTETGSRLDSVHRVYFSNSLVFDKDGNAKRIEVYYDKTPNDGVNVFSLADNGFKINYINNGKNTVAHFFPYNNIASLDIFTDYIRFTMKE